MSWLFDFIAWSAKNVPSHILHHTRCVGHSLPKPCLPGLRTDPQPLVLRPTPCCIRHRPCSTPLMSPCGDMLWYGCHWGCGHVLHHWVARIDPCVSEVGLCRGRSLSEVRYPLMEGTLATLIVAHCTQGCVPDSGRGVTGYCGRAFHERAPSVWNVGVAHDTWRCHELVGRL